MFYRNKESTYEGLKPNTTTEQTYASLKHGSCLIWFIFSSAEPKAQGELIIRDSSWRPCVHPFTLLNINISETSWPILIKFHLEHHWGGGLAAKSFGLDGIRTLVSMTTDSSHRVIMEKTL